MLIVIVGLLKLEHSGLPLCYMELTTCNGCHSKRASSLSHAFTNLGDKAAILVNIFASNVDNPVSRGSGWPRGRGRGRLMWVGVILATSVSDKGKKQM